MSTIKAILLGRQNPLLVLIIVSLFVRWATYYYYYLVYTDIGGLHFSPTADEASTYEILGRQLLSGNDLSHPLFAYRPPLQPMFIALTYLVSGSTNPLIAVFAQSFVSAGIAILTFIIAKQLRLPAPAQFWSGIIVALDPASVIIGMTLMAETLSNMFLAVSTIFVIRLMRYQNMRDAAAAGASIALATLARPTAIYYWVPIVLAITFLAPGFARNAATLVVVFSIGVLPWYLRNHIYHNIFTFSTVGNFDLLFYGAVSVKSKATGQTPQELEAQFAYELDHRLDQGRTRDQYNYSSKWKFLVSDNPQVNSEISQMALEVFLEYPLEYVITTFRPLIKIYATTNYLNILGPLRGLEIIFNLILYMLGFLATIKAWTNRNRNCILLVTTLLPIIYFTAIPVLSRAGSGMDTRARTPFTFALAILAAQSVFWIWKKYNVTKIS